MTACIMKVQIKEKGSRVWETTYSTDNKEHVLHSLAEDLIAKYIGHANYVKSIKRKQNYDGTATYTVTHKISEEYDQRTIYTVPIYC